WFPTGGMYSIVDAIHQLAIESGVRFYFNRNVVRIEVENSATTAVVAEDRNKEQVVHEADVIIGNADYHHIENKLLPEEFRNYSETYWNKREMAPGCILYFVGLNKKLTNIVHHSLFFDTNFERHAAEIYTTKQWPDDPLFYVNA